MKYGLWKKLIFSFAVVVFLLLASNAFIINKNDIKVERSEDVSQLDVLNKPTGITAFTVNDESTNLSYEELISSYVIDKVTCKNGSTARYDKVDNSLSLSDIKIPDYCTMNFRHTIYSKVVSDNPTIKTRSDFSQNFNESNTGVLYKSTESINGSSTKTVYYFAGNAKNNWVKFAGYYWRIIRTNADESVRLLFVGKDSGTTTGYIGTTNYNASYDSPKYVGYKYGEDTSLETLRMNTNDSTVKEYIDKWYTGSTENNYTQINANDPLINYEKYLSKDAVYCNDRTEGTNESYDVSAHFNFAPYYRMGYDTAASTASPSFDCTNIKDAFSVNNPEARLKYPIGLMTTDEMSYAGGVYNLTMNSPYPWFVSNSNGEMVTDVWWWSMSPVGWNLQYAYVWAFHGTDHYLASSRVYRDRAVRPVVSLKGNLVWKSGDGSISSPYEVEELSSTLYEKILSDNPTVKTRSDFSTIFTESNTGTLYKTTESISGNEGVPVYYFAGNVQKNWVKFGGYFWRIIRTNADGSVRLLFSGTSPDTTEAYIGSSKFNENYNSPKYVGYMYGNSDATLDEARTNTNDSTIKAFVDSWYEKNFTKYTKYLSKSAVYCNNRTVTNGEEYSLTSTFFYSGYYRTHYNKGLFTEVNFDCPDIKDAFSVNNTEAKLKYPIALITGEEIVAAGGKVDTNATVWYSLNSNNESITGDMWWSTMTPDYFNTTTSNVWRVVGTENLGRYRGGHVYYVNSVRPVISIASCALYSSGDGSAESPYEVNGGC